jgi:hypothetical protein
MQRENKANYYKQNQNNRIKLLGNQKLENATKNCLKRDVEERSMETKLE